jgi:hypothetical protein
MIRSAFLTVAIAATLGGCATLPSLSLNTTVSRNTILGIESAYGVALSGERTYKQLCKTHAVTGSCRTVVAQLQAADLKAIGAIRYAITFVKTYPTVDATNVISAAVTAVGDLQTILNSAGAH